MKNLTPRPPFRSGEGCSIRHRVLLDAATPGSGKRGSLARLAAKTNTVSPGHPLSEAGRGPGGRSPTWSLRQLRLHELGDQVHGEQVADILELRVLLEPGDVGERHLGPQLGQPAGRHQPVLHE